MKGSAKPPHQFLDDLSALLQIKEPRDWGKVTHRVFLENNGAYLLKKYQYSIPKLLKEVYQGETFISCNLEDIEWKADWFRSYQINSWHKRDVQKEFLEGFARRHNFKVISRIFSTNLHSNHTTGEGSQLGV